MAAFAGIKSPEPLEVGANLKQSWKKFKERFEIYMIAIGYETKSEKKKTGLMLNVIGDDGLDLYRSLPFEDGEDPWDFPTVMTKFEETANPRKDSFRAREDFYKMKQRSEQTVDQFVTEIRNKMAECAIDDNALRKSLLKQRLIGGLKNVGVATRIHDKGEDFSFEDAVKLARNAEYARREMDEKPKETKEVDAVHKTYHKPAKKYQTSDNRESRYQNHGGENTGPRKRYEDCERCGKKHGWRCPAYGKVCKKCGGLSHFAKKCKSKKKRVHEVEVNPERSYGYRQQNDFVVDTVSTKKEDDGSDWIVPLEIEGTTIPVKLDTGADIPILSKEDYCALSPRPRLNTNTNIAAYAYGRQEPISLLGSCMVNVKIKGQNRKCLFYVAEGLTSLLSKELCVKWGFVKRVWTVVENKESDSETGVCDVSDKYDQIFEKYKDVFEGLGELPGVHVIKLREDAEPVIEACRKVPFALHDKLKAELDRMEDLGVIDKVTEPTEWVSSLVMVTKPNGDLRVCLDPRNLNKAIKREHYKMSTREEIMSKFSGSKVFSKFDASSGFWQMKLDDQSAMYCTFNSPFGRYKFRRLPFGISSASEVFSRTIDDIFADMPRVETNVDDIIVHGRDDDEHDATVIELLDRCRKVGLKLNRKKCVIGVSELVFIGDLLTDKGVRPDPSKVDSIVNIDTPTDRTELQRFLGMVNYLARYIPDLSNKTAPLRVLLDKNIQWQWQHEQERAFNELKEVLSSEPILKYYDPDKPILVSSDASQKGIGCVLLQRHGDEWHPVAYASKAMTKAEQNYAQIEKETLCIVYAHERFHQYLYGQTYECETDHKPLVSIFAKPLADVPPRIQRMRLRLQKYDFTVKYTPGKYMYAADTLSRAYGTEVPKSDIETDVKAYVDFVMGTVQMTDDRLTSVREHTQNDAQMKVLAETIQKGWPNEKQNCPLDVSEYWNYRDELYVIDGVIYKNRKVVIPRALRKLMLDKVHEGHLGEVKCKSRAREVLFWPMMSKDIENVVHQCETCLLYRNRQQKEPLISTPVSTKPWSYVATDLFVHRGKHYVLVVDSYSNFPEVEELRNESSKCVVDAMKKIFGRQGIPDQVFSDNGPCYASVEFKRFSESWDFEHKTSSPRYPQSNGLAERTVQTVKRIFDKNVDKEKGLLIYRDAELECGKTPAELLGRKLRANLPVVNHRPRGCRAIVNRRKVAKQKQAMYYNRQSKPLSKLSPGNVVRLRDYEHSQWKNRATVVRKVAPRSYNVQAENGACYRRNRRDLLLTNEKIVPRDEGLHDPDIVQSANVPNRTVPKPLHVPNNARSDVIEPSVSETPVRANVTQAIEPGSVVNQPDMTLRRSSRNVKKPTRLIEQV